MLKGKCAAPDAAIKKARPVISPGRACAKRELELVFYRVHRDLSRLGKGFLLCLADLIKTIIRNGFAMKRGFGEHYSRLSAFVNPFFMLFRIDFLERATFGAIF